MASTTGVDWSVAWEERLSRSNHQVQLRSRGISSEDFWDGFSRWAEMHRHTGYPGEALERVLEAVGPRTTVLDVGSGHGAFAVPLARVAQHVTAVEPSPGQVARLLEGAAAAGVNNLTVVQKRWEDLDGAEIGCHDIVLAAYSFQMKDIRAALDKMHRAAGRSLFLVHFAGHDLAEALRDITGGPEAGPDYTLLLNVLHQMGLTPSVSILARDYEIPLDLQLDAFVYSHGLSAEQRGALRRHLEAEGRVLTNGGVQWARRQYKDALMRLDKEEPCR